MLGDETTAFLCGEDRYGNYRGFCEICKEKCPSYSQSGEDDLRCSRCHCGASAHKIFSIEDIDMKGFLSSMTNEILPQLNINLTQDGINFNSFVVMFKLLNKNANKNQFSWLFQLLREAGFTILKVEIKQLRKNDINSSNFVQLQSNISNFYDSANNNQTQYNDNLYKTTCVEGKRDMTFLTMSKLEKKMKSLAYSVYYNNNINPAMSGSTMLQGNTMNKKYYDEFNNPVLVICLSLNMQNIISYFEQAIYKIINSDSYIRNLASSIKLIYYSKTKLKALWDVQVLFPGFFKVNKFFQLLTPKIRREGKYEKQLSIYKDALFSNSFNLVQIKNFNSLSELKKFSESEMENKTKKNPNQKIGLNIMDFYDTYLTNEKLKTLPCSLLQISNVGIDKEITSMSSTLAFNNDITIIGYDNEDEYEEISNFYFNNSKNCISSYEHIFLIFRPFVLRSGLNETILNLFRINNFYILARKTTILTKEQISLLYNHEFPTEAKLTYNEYEHMMSDSNVELVVMSKFSAFVDVNTLLGFSKKEINVNQYNNIQTNSFMNTNNGITPVEKSEKNCFKDISSFININEIITNIYNEKIKFNSKDIHGQMLKIKNNLLKFSSFFNLYVYCNQNQVVNGEEVNYFFPRFGDIQEVFVLVRNFDIVKDNLILMKFEILETKQLILTENEYANLFEEYLNLGLITPFDYSTSKEYLTKHEVTLVRMVKPGGFFEMKKIIGKTNYNFVRTNINLDYLNKSSTLHDKQEKSFEILQNNTYLIKSSKNIEYFYPMLNQKIFTIEGGFINRLDEYSTNTLIEIIKSCLKCTVGENMRYDTKNSVTNISLIERYLNFYHFHSEEPLKDFFLKCLSDYMFPKFFKNERERNSIENHFYEFIRYNENLNNKIIPQISFFVESTNLGFYEVRIPLLNNTTSGGFQFLDMMEYILTKNYLYYDKDFYSQLVSKSNDNIVIKYLPYEQGTIEPFLALDFVNDQNNPELLNNSSLKFSTMNISSYRINQNERGIQTRLLYTTKYESTKQFYKQCINTSPKSHIVPKNYHYRIKPDDIYMNINRIYEVEEFGGLFFIDIAIQDFMKYRPPELGEKIINGQVVQYSNPLNTLYPDMKVQFSLPGFLWGRKLMKICTIVEDSSSATSNYGPVVYYPKENKVMGIINTDNMKDYEMYLYTNLLEDIRTSGYEFFDKDSFDIIERKMFEIFNSDIFKNTRVKENIRLMPTRINENNLRVCKNNPNVIIPEINSIDPKNEMEFHSIFKKNEEENYNELQESKLKTLESNNEDEDNNGYDIKRTTTAAMKTKIAELKKQEDMTKDILSKNVYLIDLFCFNGVKYHMYAAILFLIKVYYKKIHRKVNLITLPLATTKDKEKEYDRFIEAILTGFYSHSHLNYSNLNDKDRYNAYHIEYFLYCLKEMKFIINECNLLKQKVYLIDQYLQNTGVNEKEYHELIEIRDQMTKAQESKLEILGIIFDEAKTCPLTQPEEDLDDYVYKYAPKERYHIPMYMKEKWETDLNNEKYMKTLKVNYSFLKNLDKLNEAKERTIYSSTGFNIANDYYLIKKSMLREPEKQPDKFILLDKKKKDKTELKNKYFGKMIRRQLEEDITNKDSNNILIKRDNKANAKVISKTLGLDDYINNFTSNTQNK